MRKDGRPLVTDHPVTAWDMIDYVHADDMPSLPAEAIVCALRGPDRTAWMDDGIDPDDESLWDS